MRYQEICESQYEQAIHLTRLGKFHKGKDELAEYVPERLTHSFALHPKKWIETFWSLTNKEPKKLKYYGPIKLDIVPGTLVADMTFANYFYWTKNPEEKEAYAKKYLDSIKPYPVNIDEYRYPELLIPR